MDDKREVVSYNGPEKCNDDSRSVRVVKKYNYFNILIGIIAFLIVPIKGRGMLHNRVLFVLQKLGMYINMSVVKYILFDD